MIEAERPHDAGIEHKESQEAKVQRMRRPPGSVIQRHQPVLMTEEVTLDLGPAAGSGPEIPTDIVATLLDRQEREKEIRIAMMGSCEDETLDLSPVPEELAG